MKPWFAIVILSFVTLSLGIAAAQVPDGILRAMHDELHRSVLLSLPGAKKPYFVEYTAGDGASIRIEASRGALESRSQWPYRNYSVNLRMGSYQLDTSNYRGNGSSVSGFDRPGVPMDSLSSPETYNLFRRYLWLTTDYVYKDRLEILAHKQARLNSSNRSETLDDFAHAPELREIGEPRHLQVDEEAWAKRARSLSTIVNAYPAVQSSVLMFFSTAGAFYLANSEGTVVRIPASEGLLRVRLTAQASDGMRLREGIEFHAPDAAGLPSDEEMRREIAALAENATAFTKAPKGEEYNGPVLFEGVAGAQIMAEVLAHNLTLIRQPVQERDGNFFAFGNDLSGRKGARVLPDWMDVLDDPTATTFHGHALVGSYTIDREGVRAQPVQLIVKGILKDYLRTRQIIHGYSDSNGHARLSNNMQGHTASISNLFITARETVPAAELRRRMLDMCKEREKAYGIVVRRMDYPSVATGDEAMQMVQHGMTNGALPVSLPVRIFKVYADGHEEQIRGVAFRGFNAKSLKDIVAAGDDAAPFNLTYSHNLFAMLDGGEPTHPALVVAPSILVDDLDLKPLEGDLPKLPIVDHP